jgi:DNA-binding NarL/FixJ family response regulator
MAKQRISDTERAEKVRQWARQASARRRERLTLDGKEQLLCWIPAATRQRLDALAAAKEQTLSEATAAAIEAGLDAKTTPTTTQQTSLPGVAIDRDSQIAQLAATGMNSREIAAQLGDVSERTVRRKMAMLREATS